ncbi:MAG: AAA family ATPase [Bacteroidales bacterium]|nr:AAA family ATPase [Bacteroidales bacterium]
MKYPIGIQNFKNLRKGGFVYVDKTAYIYDLAHNRPCCFLSRPRRFGKSLLLSTMEAYFCGEKSLFEGLAIYELEQEWTKHPVLHLDMNNGNFSSVEKLEEFLSNELHKWEEEYDVEVLTSELGIRFENVIDAAFKKTGRQAVILIDEYDKPLLQVITKEWEQRKYRSLLKPFYGTLKKAEDHIKFIFLTGVTKFGKLSVFSDLNQLKDISLMPEYKSICGISEEEFQHYFQPELKDFSAAQGLDQEETLKELKRMYDGYHFSRIVTSGVFNPYSLLNSLDEKDFGSYWFQTGIPSFLVDLLKESHYHLTRLDNAIVTEKLLTCVDDPKSTPITVLYQSGFLTIKSYDPLTRFYTLDFPNEDAKRIFLTHILSHFSCIDSQEIFATSPKIG